MSTNKNGTSFDQFVADLLKKPEIRREYDALKPKYENIRRSIKQNEKLH